MRMSQSCLGPEGKTSQSNKNSQCEDPDVKKLLVCSRKGKATCWLEHSKQEGERHKTKVGRKAGPDHTGPCKP